MKPYEKNKVPHVVFGEGVSKQAGERLSAIGAKKCLVVAGKVVTKIGLVAPILKTLKTEGVDYVIYDNVQPDPSDWICIECAEMLKKENCDAVLAIGGGSAIDIAKSANLIANIPEKIKDLHDYSALGGKMKPTFTKFATFMVIPTTSGTGAEATASGVISDTKRNLKYSFASEQMMADINLVDPLLTLGIPPVPTTLTGVDILSHVIEELVGVGQNDYSNLIYMECVRKVWKWLPIAIKEPNNVEARSQLSWASHNALSNGSLPNGHAVAHAIGATYHLVHGHACIITLPAVIRHHAETATESINDIATIMGIPTTEDAVTVARRVADGLVDFYKKLGLSTMKETMKEKGYKDDINTFVEKCIPGTLDDFKSRLWNPPIHRDEDRETLKEVLEMIYNQD